MLIDAAAGPIGSPTSRDGAGFVSATALRCTARAGEHAQAPLPVSGAVAGLEGHTVAEGEVLRYYLFPELDAGLTWGATFVALDLEFEDGTLLSALDPLDQYGTPATAQGMGEGKILYADQWNDVQVQLDAAAGRTIARVLVATAIPGDGGADEAEDLVTWIDGPYLAPAAPTPPIDDPVAWVDTRRGTYASGDFSRGNTLPLTAWPNGFAFFTPMTDARTRRWVYEYHRANGDDNRPRLQGIGVSHQPSPWMGDRNQFVMMPLRGEDPDASPLARSLAFDHAEETARPDLYAVRLEDGTGLRLAPTDHGAIQEIAFPPGETPVHLLLEGVDQHARIDAAGAVLDGSLRAWVDSGLEQGYAGADGATRMFVAAHLDPAPMAVRAARGANPGAALLTFAPGTTRVTLRLVTSFIGLDQARRTFAQEVEGRSLEQVRAAAHAAWTERLDVVRIEGATPAQRRTLAGNLYRLNLYPNSHWENAGTLDRPDPVHASPVLPVKGHATDTRTNAQVRPGKMHVNNGFWDTYRTAWPAYALLYPELCAELADGFVQQFREGGWMARWSSPGYADCMTGTSSDIAFADAAVKGVPLPDPLAAYEAGLRNATVAPPFAEVGRKGNERAVFTGYVDTDTPESVSWALEAHINDAGLAAQADLLAEDAQLQLPEDRRRTLWEEAAYLRSRSANYALLFDARIGFFQGRRRDGSIAQEPEDFDPRVWGGDFTETDGWNFAFHAPHDGEGLAALYGGREALLEKLEAFFVIPENADLKGTYGHVIHEMDEARAVQMGQFGMSNQPSHHIPFLFHHAGAPHRAMEVVREVQRRLFVGEQIGQGYPGDEDNGEMSAWWLLTALGLYPLQLATGRYHVVAPLFARAEVRPLGGPAFSVVADGQAPEHPYVTALSLGGRDHTMAALEHADLRGELRFTLAGEPTGWGEVPPSPTTEGAFPQPLMDLLERDADDPLLDDDSRTERTWDRASVVIDLPALPGPGKARFLTLTSGSVEGGDPIAWRLEGSEDGETWRLLDERSDQGFRWRRQTRPFEIASPRECTHHRIVVTTAQGPLRLAQVELLL
ncbi:GH92 family glycosyl hydrolase [Brachybacterium muris]|uniref:Alpha-mannosidase n=1 Tax=Brachybacterium muris UCD-AY4 TaxID=1249481 RepID=A0A022L5B5_9MICO|nr:GH92 family glycosyl hydrolase [Brachybacterium muris]EYT51213.1 alpha-mannosidase [Brachybacterium muris UCD-AY4]MCT1654649.1 GH92 family glycosyl hydrolase [Brachybacterium muris]